MELTSSHACFGGSQRYYQHTSSAIGLPMRFAVYLPPAALQGQKVPALLYLAGLTCTEETFPIKAGAQRLAAELGLALIAPDTSPRGAGVAGAGQEIKTRPFQLVTGRKWLGSAFGGVKGRSELPGMVQDAMAGKIQLEPFVTHTMGLPDINHAFDLMHEGKSIRSVVNFAQA